MASNRHESTRSVEELDELFERDLEAAAAATAEFFKHEVAVAITNISEIQQVAQARILADSQVASATIMSDAEVKAAQLLADAQKANMKALLRDYDQSNITGNLSDEIADIRTTTTVELSKSAKKAITDIERTAQDTIEKLKTVSQDAIEQINALSEDVKTLVAESAQKAKQRLGQQRSHHRTMEEVTDNAKKAAVQVIEDAKTFSRKLHSLTQQSLDNLHKTTDEGLEVIQDATQKAKKG